MRRLDNMLQVLQTFGVFPDALCQDAPIVLQDDLACSGCEESFGIAVSAAQQSVFNEIAAASTWPVTVDFPTWMGTARRGACSPE